MPPIRRDRSSESTGFNCINSHNASGRCRNGLVVVSRHKIAPKSTPHRSATPVLPVIWPHAIRRYSRKPLIINDINAQLPVCQLAIITLPPPYHRLPPLLPPCYPHAATLLPPSDQHAINTLVGGWGIQGCAILAAFIVGHGKPSYPERGQGRRKVRTLTWRVAQSDYLLRIRRSPMLRT